MRYSTCKCGKMEFWNSGVYTPCTGCKHCGTGEAGQPIKPHEFVSHDVETNEGTKHLDRCRWCTRTRKQLEAELSANSDDVRPNAT